MKTFEVGRHFVWIATRLLTTFNCCPSLFYAKSS